MSVHMRMWLPGQWYITGHVIGDLYELGNGFCNATATMEFCNRDGLPMLGSMAERHGK